MKALQINSISYLGHYAEMRQLDLQESELTYWPRCQLLQRLYVNFVNWMQANFKYQDLIIS